MAPFPPTLLAVLLLALHPLHICASSAPKVEDNRSSPFSKFFTRRAAPRHGEAFVVTNLTRTPGRSSFLDRFGSATFFAVKEARGQCVYGRNCGSKCSTF